MGKTILVLLDACRFGLAKETGGYLEHLIETSQGAKYCVEGELPSSSRPMYETTLTGLVSSAHGITDNRIIRLSRCENIFKLCRENQLKTAAAAYYWMSELYVRAPFNPLTDRFKFGGGGLIDYGIFYFEDMYPDTHLFLDGEYLRTVYEPDFLLIHPMNIDYKGHLYGGESSEYLTAGIQSFECLARALPVWQEAGYQVVVTADHGMSVSGYHGGSSDKQRLVPLYIFSQKAVCGDFSDKVISQLNTAPLLCRLLDIEPAAGMLQDIEIKMTE